jgi:hypothetical protein
VGYQGCRVKEPIVRKAKLRPSAVDSILSTLISLHTADLRYLLVELAGAGRLALAVRTDQGTAVFRGNDISGTDNGDVARLHLSPFDVLCGEATWQEALESRLEKKSGSK